MAFSNIYKLILTISSTSLAIAKEAVKPGDSIPIRFIKRSKPLFDSSSITKSLKPWPGPKGKPWAKAKEFFG